MNIDPVISSVLTILVFSVSFLFWNLKKAKEQNIELDEKIKDFHQSFSNIQQENMVLQNKNSALEAKLEASQEATRLAKEEFAIQSKNLELKLNEIMQTRLDEKLKKFDETSLKSLDLMLKPFKQNLDSFEKKVMDSQEHSTKKFAELSKEIELLAKAGLNISAEAQNLTQALKGKKQSQGSWGEMLLESVLEYSGLIKGQHYLTQESSKDEQNRLKRPDVVVKLPQNKTMIIDSKVSLNDYDDFVRAENEVDRAEAAKRVSVSFKNHIDNLSSKEYQRLKSETLEYIFMFVPIEGAFAVATQSDNRLYEYALKKHIVIVNPSTLTVTLRTIYLYWQSEKSNEFASKLFEEAGKIYDKMAIFADNFAKFETQLGTLNSTYENCQKQLAHGNGNILTRFENFKKFGARATKNIKDSKIEFDNFEVLDMNELM